MACCNDKKDIINQLIHQVTAKSPSRTHIRRKPEKRKTSAHEKGLRHDFDKFSASFEAENILDAKLAKRTFRKRPFSNYELLDQNKLPDKSCRNWWNVSPSSKNPLLPCLNHRK